MADISTDLGVFQDRETCTGRFGVVYDPQAFPPSQTVVFAVPAAALTNETTTNNYM